MISYYVAQRSLLNVMWQPEWEGSLGENGHMNLYGRVPLLFTWDYHNIVNWLYPNTKKKGWRREEKRKKGAQFWGSPP